MKNIIKNYLRDTLMIGAVVVIATYLLLVAIYSDSTIFHLFN
jgi:hypothetical protein